MRQYIRSLPLRLPSHRGTKCSSQIIYMRISCGRVVRAHRLSTHDETVKKRGDGLGNKQEIKETRGLTDGCNWRRMPGITRLPQDGRAIPKISRWLRTSECSSLVPNEETLSFLRTLFTSLLRCILVVSRRIPTAPGCAAHHPSCD